MGQSGLTSIGKILALALAGDHIVGSGINKQHLEAKRWSDGMP
jgi:hypothetical protein